MERFKNSKPTSIPLASRYQLYIDTQLRNLDSLHYDMVR
jgi:hypothetical protein